MRGFLRFVLVMALVIGLYIGYRVFFGAKIGETCSDSASCAALTGVQCLHDPTGSYCTPLCTSDHDCPTDWVCASAHDLDPNGGTQRVCSRAHGVVRATPAPPSEPAPHRHR